MSIPVTDILLKEEFEEKKERQPDLAWKIGGGRMCGLVDGIEAVKQAAWKRLETEAGVYDIYPESYGLKTVDLIGDEVDYAITTLKRRIAETLMRDDRILWVSDFTQSELKRKITLTFKVNSVYGDFELGKVVQI